MVSLAASNRNAPLKVAKMKHLLSHITGSPEVGQLQGWSIQVSMMLSRVFTLLTLPPCRPQHVGICFLSCHLMPQCGFHSFRQIVLNQSWLKPGGRKGWTFLPLWGRRVFSSTPTALAHFPWGPLRWDWDQVCALAAREAGNVSV